MFIKHSQNITTIILVYLVCDPFSRAPHRRWAMGCGRRTQRSPLDMHPNLTFSEFILIVPPGVPDPVRPFFARYAPPLGDGMRKKDTEIPPKRASV
jgi:hypothetical protein